MQVRYHDLTEPVSLLGRLRDWLEPAAHAKMVDGPDRNAVWLPSGLVAVSGNTYASEGDTLDVTPAGLSLIDPSDWSTRRVSDPSPCREDEHSTRGSQKRPEWPARRLKRGR
jgi:hypothetical protein